MQKTKIEWTDYTWNPIKGICPVGCWYCYARRMYQRFGWEKRLYYFIDDTWRQIELLKKPSKIFVCSTIEIFHPKIKPYWRDQVFREIEKYSQHTFQILTKFPQNIDRPMPDNVYLGVSVTNQEDLPRITQIELVEAKKRFVSFEPLLEFINWDGLRLEFSSLDWIIVGQLTGHGKKYEPKKYWINQIKFYARYYGIPIFLKNNLKGIWGESLIQEFPNEKN